MGDEMNRQEIIISKCFLNNKIHILSPGEQKGRDWNLHILERLRLSQEIHLQNWCNL